jgi:glycopeptide antibiotics resistance protein
MTNSTNKLTIALFLIYLFVLAWILLFKLGVQFSYMEKRSVSLIPFREPFDVGETILNMVIFIPLGIYAGILFRRWNPGRMICFFFLTSLIIEGLPFVFRIGAFALTDTITNTFGGFMGLLVGKAIGKLFANSVKAQKFINIGATIGTAVMILLLILLKTNRLGIRYQ